MNQTQKILKWVLEQDIKFDIEVRVHKEDGIVVIREGYLPAFIWCDRPQYIINQFNKLKKKVVK